MWKVSSTPGTLRVKPIPQAEGSDQWDVWARLRKMGSVWFALTATLWDPTEVTGETTLVLLSSFPPRTCSMLGFTQV